MSEPHVHLFVRRPYPEDYAGDCECGEGGRWFDGAWDEAPSYRKRGASSVVPVGRGDSHELGNKKAP